MLKEIFEQPRAVRDTTLGRVGQESGRVFLDEMDISVKDFRNLNRVYLPRDALAAAGATVEQLGGDRSPPQLLQCLQALAVRTEALLDESKSLSPQVRDLRLGLEISIIQSFADRIVDMLKVRDPLSERVHLGKMELLALSAGGVASEMTRRAFGRGPVSRPAAGA